MMQDPVTILEILQDRTDCFLVVNPCAIFSGFLPWKAPVLVCLGKSLLHILMVSSCACCQSLYLRLRSEVQTWMQRILCYQSFVCSVLTILLWLFFKEAGDCLGSKAKVSKLLLFICMWLKHDRLSAISIHQKTFCSNGFSYSTCTCMFFLFSGSAFQSRNICLSPGECLYFSAFTVTLNSAARKKNSFRKLSVTEIASQWSIRKDVRNFSILERILCSVTGGWTKKINK